MSDEPRPSQTVYPDGRRAEIKFVSTGMKYRPKSSEVDYGDTNEVSGRIRINSRPPVEEQAGTLLHEYLHHLCVVMNMHEDAREDWVQAMEFNLRSLIRLNKDNFIWIIKNL
jgi:hypothetical protein